MQYICGKHSAHSVWSLPLVDSMIVLDHVVFHNLVPKNPTAETNEEASAYIYQ
jgi:hypothetical protein